MEQKDIYNLALGHVKARQITTITDDVIQDDECNRYWELALKSTLAANNWGFAKVIVALVETDTTDAWVTTTTYAIGDYVNVSDVIYYCLTAHTAGIFATDLAAAKWEQRDAYTPLNWDFAYFFPSDCLAPWLVYGEETVDKGK